jgi:energy-coupling factor transport system ATP-binding protein
MIQLQDVGFSYDGYENAVIKRANLEISTGEFVLVCGPTGSGKSTLLKIINGLAPHFTGGTLSGRLLLNGVDHTGGLPHNLASMVGYVNQQPEGSFVADTVEDEIAFSMEQLGFDANEMTQRVKRFAALVGIGDLLTSDLANLSGGQQQRVAIAAALAAGQKLLVLDEPTSALDPSTAADIILLLKQIAKQENVSILLAEHRLERVLKHVDSVIIVHGDGSVSKSLPQDAFREYRLVPPIVELSLKLGWSPVILDPSSVVGKSIQPNQWTLKPSNDLSAAETLLETKDLQVSYGQTEAVKPINLNLHAGEVLAVMGENGSGKSSLIWAIHGLGKRTGGSVTSPWGDPLSLSDEERLGAITLVPQKASDLLFLNSLAEELQESDTVAQVPPTSTASLFAQFAGRVDPRKHPRDLSAGQQLALVLAVQLVKGARVVLLDEPTRGLDYEAKRALARIIEKLKDEGKGVVLASHDIEFVAMLATRVLVLESGRIVEEGNPQEVFADGRTLASQTSLALATPGLVSVDQVRAS